MMEIEVDDNIGAVHNGTLIGDDKKNIWKKRIPGDNLLIGDDKKYIWKKRIPDGDNMERWKATAPGGDTDRGVTLSWSWGLGIIIHF